MTSPHEQALAAAASAIKTELHYGDNFVAAAEQAISAYLAALPADVDGLVAEFETGRFATWLQALNWCARAAEALRSLSAKLAAVERERDATRGLLTDLADTFERFLGDLGHPQDSWQRDQIARARKEGSGDA